MGNQTSSNVTSTKANQGSGSGKKTSNNHLQIIPLLPNLVVVVLELAPPLVGMIGKTMKFLMCPTDLEEVVQEVVWEVIKEVVVQVLLDNKWRKRPVEEKGQLIMKKIMIRTKKLISVTSKLIQMNLPTASVTKFLMVK